MFIGGQMGSQTHNTLARTSRTVLARALDSSREVAGMMVVLMMVMMVVQLYSCRCKPGTAVSQLNSCTTAVPG